MLHDKYLISYDAIWHGLLDNYERANIKDVSSRDAYDNMNVWENLQSQN